MVGTDSGAVVIVSLFSCQAFGVFGLCQIHAFIDYLRSKLSRAQFDTLFWSLVVLMSSAVVVVGGTLTFMGSKSAPS